MILGLGIPELLIIVVVVLIIFGPKNLPKLGSALGKTVKNVREGMEEDDDKDPKKVEASQEDGAEEVVADEDDADVEDAPGAEGVVKFCPQCGAENAADAGFCKKCGAKLGE
ncbi:MAG: twin-arginine translocase TatA/TatE family subunit [Coriobacteriaceae bacterium]|uniref:twin-arginine translocase TatA/TatE family subunit n=1 Tax=Tractidigestivibacter sp. TaxID=2847320 RepID=UPI002A828A6F|nr:twin-arginine translocase TatA/TatE family subunit [Tractidigestivibacter sp.]MCI6274746.1 twin-arginine translocase TatA/TatE family subunit [Coriobacteriaceae bacterium]MCI6547735.1 twin-arginine translocase TatA/TatE family subunit [Coriobacteriaceae bacterium]MCI6843767.1 twin-arginine translocase TatA/TatE family subunit [Coriobacteriaceae bacterium]MCI7438851.1 twin-arginine translocase TatA/TatE family subunit [Coriobacteriaceae bacterium]MDD7584879.1 twin-arginine translocase TatA/T